jgi:hypothetical protein
MTRGADDDAPADLAALEQVPHGRTAQRLLWHHLPTDVRRLVEDRLGAAVVTAESQGAGFTPGLASRLTAANGARLFVKAASRRSQADIADAYAAEGRMLRDLPDPLVARLPMARLLWWHEDEAWFVLALACLEGRRPRRPWVAAELNACLDALETVADTLTPVPPGIILRPLTEDLPGLLTGWEHLRQTAPDRPHLDEAAALAAAYPRLPGNDAFVHSDARDDNFLVDGSGRAWLCDWNWPALGPVWQDTVDVLVSAYGDGLDADALLSQRRLTRDADPDHVDSWLAALCGFMLEARDRPVPASSPHLRTHARWYAEVLWAWLSRRRGWT